MHASRSTRCATVSTRPASRSTRSTTSSSTTSRSSNSSALGNLSRLRAARLPLVSHGIAAVAQEKLFQKRLLRQELEKLAPDGPGRSGCCLPSTTRAMPLRRSSLAVEEAAVLTMDGVANGRRPRSRSPRQPSRHAEEIHFPHSLGLLYAAFTAIRFASIPASTGHGPRPLWRAALRADDPRSPRRPETGRQLPLDQSYLTIAPAVDDQCAVRALFGGPRAPPKRRSPARHGSRRFGAAVTEEIVLRLTRALAVETGARNLCLAGGVALNCVANGKVLRDGSFERIWVQPAAGDAGGALGAALAAIICTRRRRACRSTRSTRCRAAIWVRLCAAGHRTAPRRVGARFEVMAEPALLEKPRQRWSGEGVAGSGAWNSDRAPWVRARSSRRAQPGDAEDAHLLVKITRKLPPVRSLGAAR